MFLKRLVHYLPLIPGKVFDRIEAVGSFIFTVELCGSHGPAVRQPDSGGLLAADNLKDLRGFPPTHPLLVSKQACRNVCHVHRLPVQTLYCSTVCPAFKSGCSPTVTEKVNRKTLSPKWTALWICSNAPWCLASVDWTALTQALCFFSFPLKYFFTNDILILSKS